MAEIRNIVSTASIGCTIDLYDVSKRLLNKPYDPRRAFRNICLRLLGTTTVSVYASGNMCCVGSRTIEDSERAARLLTSMIEQLGYATSFNSFTVCNIVATAAYHSTVHLPTLAAATESMFEPELFPSLVYRLPEVTVLVFATGKLVFNRARCIKDIENAYLTICIQLDLLQ